MKKGTVLKTAFSEYEIIEQIGQGGCGVVYKCSSDHGDFAVKTINKDVGTEKIKRFKNELNFCQMNNGPYIIRVIDFGNYSDGSNEYLFYVMALYSKSLRTIMKEHLSADRIISVFSNICSGLKIAHLSKCVHRDLKPENVLISGNGEAIISDFGIAHFDEINKVTNVETTIDSRLANFTYRAPEQIAGLPSTSATDIFSLGLILNEMFTELIPYGDNYKKIENIDKNYAFLDKIVSKMICQDAASRYQTIEELLIDYQAYSLENSKNKEIARLNIPLKDSEIDDDLFVNPANPIDIKMDGGTLLVTLSNVVNRTWIGFFVNSLRSYTTLPFCYRNFEFYGSTASYATNRYGKLDEYSIKGLVKEFKEACKITNAKYHNYLLSEKSRIKNEEIEARNAEIKRLEKENQMNMSLKDLLKN